jgi:hypothetical protein
VSVTIPTSTAEAVAGTPLALLLADARIADAVEVLFTGFDRGVEDDIEQSYQRSLPLGEALREEVLLAWELNGAPLPPQHGFPLRLVVPGWYTGHRRLIDSDDDDGPSTRPCVPQATDGTTRPGTQTSGPAVAATTLVSARSRPLFVARCGGGARCATAPRRETERRRGVRRRECCSSTDTGPSPRTRARPANRVW